MKKYISILLSLFSVIFCKAQEYVPILDETLTVNSTTSLSGYTRNKAELQLPEKAIGYIYRISIFPKGQSIVENPLMNLLKQVDPSVAATSSLMQFAIANNDGNSVDAFIFNNVYDASDFYDKKDNNWSACKAMPNRSNVCYYTKECIGRNIYFGFRNNNISQGLDVKLEVVAIVDTSKAAAFNYSYTIQNGTNQEVKYSLSLDRTTWQEQQLRSNYQLTYTFEKPEAYIKIQTSLFKSVLYKITPEDRYRIFWNQNEQKWDLTRF